MKIKKILETIDEFFDKKQKQIKDHIKQFGKYGNRDIDAREKAILLTLPMGYRKKLKERFVELESNEVKNEDKVIGCGKHDKKHPELTRSCGDILFSNKIWICDNCRKKTYTKEQRAIIDDVSLGGNE